MIPANIRTIPSSVWTNIAKQFETPCFVYDATTFKKAAQQMLSFPNPFGLTVRFAMKASPTKAILKLLHKEGLHFDASSAYEAERAIAAGIPASFVSLSSQQLPRSTKIINDGVSFNACSNRQLKWFSIFIPNLSKLNINFNYSSKSKKNNFRFGENFHGGSVGLRLNPGKGTGETVKTIVAGKDSAFGIWHEDLDEVKEMIAKYELKVVRIHTHIGSGTDTETWGKVAKLSLGLVEQFPDVTILNLGGGFKVNRMSWSWTDIQSIGTSVSHEIQQFYERTNRKLHLEIEPGTFISAFSGYILSSIEDLLTTGRDGHNFIKLDAGMTEILRPSLYDAQHPLFIVPTSTRPSQDKILFSVVGHCCESGDLITLRNEKDELIPVELDHCEIGDLFVIGAAGAYCAAMSTKNYNSFPEAPEVMLDDDLNIHLIRSRQTLAQITQNEI